MYIRKTKYKTTFVRMRKFSHDKYPNDCDDDFTVDCRRRDEDTELGFFITVGLI